MNPKVDTYILNLEKWRAEIELLRSIVLDSRLHEDFKWMHPCYTWKNKNVVIIHEFKDYCAIMFQKGSLLSDTEGVLVKITENVQGARQIRFTSTAQIEKMESTIRAYLFEAIEIEKAGLQIKLKETSDYPVPEELKVKFDSDPEFKAAFEKLTPGRQRGYLLYFSKAKQSNTRTSRILNSEERIYQGKGIHDCICGLSKRHPRCDGSHSALRTKEM